MYDTFQLIPGLISCTGVTARLPGGYRRLPGDYREVTGGYREITGRLPGGDREITGRLLVMQEMQLGECATVTIANLLLQLL